MMVSGLVIAVLIIPYEKISRTLSLIAIVIRKTEIYVFYSAEPFWALWLVFFDQLVEIFYFLYFVLWS